ncbi:MAG: hypothetical protein AAGG68_07535 [Bacteroidota bacterium]
MKKSFLVSLALLLNIAASACDVCGCSISNNGTGLLATYKFNTLGMRWYSTPFQQVPEFGDTKDYFYTAELFFQFHPTERLRLSVFQPIKWHQRQGGEGVNDADLYGLGDTRLFANYALIKELRVIGASTLYWEIGAGLQLPIGKYDERIHMKNLPENFNLSNGSWGYIAQSNLIYNTLDIGFVWNVLYQHNQPARTDYQFGNQFSSNWTIFAQKSFTKKWKTIPYLGAYFEQVSADRLYNDKIAHGTGGEGWFLNGGVNLLFNNFLFGANYAYPITNNYAEAEMEARPRVAMNLSYIF